jgi:glycosyltransferase involved in cell wall biosynthesis
MTYLPDTLESVLRQTFTDFEVLIVNDGSSDNIIQWTAEIKDPRVQLISQTNQGVSAARNKGIVQAKGEYIAFLDADDLWEPTKLEKQVLCLDENPAVGLVHTSMLLVNEQGQSLGKIITSNAEGKAWKQLLEHNTILTSSVIVRQSCLETVGGFDQNLRTAEDWDLWIRIASRYPLAFIKEPLVFYRLHPNNTTKNWRFIEQDLHIVIEKVFQTVPSELQYLKNHSYGYTNLFLAWKALSSADKDWKQASKFRNSAAKRYPRLRYSYQYIRLSLAIAMMKWFGANGFSKVLSLIYTLRRRISSRMTQ